MKIFIKTHKEWFSSFSSAFVGTLLGIGITFFVNDIMENKSKEKMAYKFLTISLDEMERHITSVENEIPMMRKNVTMFENILEYYPEQLDEVPDSLSDKFVSFLASISVPQTFNYSEKLFKENITSLEVFDDLSVISDFHELFDGVHTLDFLRDKLLKIKNELIGSYRHTRSIFFDENDEIVKDVFSNANIYDMLLFYRAWTETLAYYVQFHKENLYSIKKNLGITDEDINTARSNRGIEMANRRKTITL